ncbi:MAG: AMP-binding protein [Methylobacteriaceae bacterium]|nr:AMP-binding protein [Methylobacteriaceae bacterium]
MAGQAETIAELLAAGADDAPALEAPGGPAPLTYGGLRALAHRVVGELNAAGIGRGDRVAIVLPHGPEAATAFMAIGAGATAAPLNPAYKAEEFEFYLTDLQARLLVVAAGEDTPALAVAAKLGVPVARLHPTPETGAGDFRLDLPRNGGAAAQGGPAEPDDVALVLHTSGTTSRPKIVPLAQRNVCASARHIRESLAFTAADRGLNIMPLFHIHGLIAGILAPLSAGGAVSCTPGFNALKFFGWMSEARPTWYTAVPTMHQAILGRASRARDVIAANPLRFLRSSSSSLPPQVMAELEATFGAPVIEAYGMTEAAHQMASNPLPPRARHPGSVGVAAGPEIRIIDRDGRPLPAGETGEIAIRGPNVMSGYEANPGANAEAFTADGFFRTGDQGTLDPEGYVRITGRLKEIINRGGEKISPREVDEVLMDHPAVSQCVAFAMPHDKLGEEVAAAIVLREGQTVAEAELRRFASERLASFKVPAKILVLDEIPKGATGKLQRIGLAAKLGLG